MSERRRKADEEEEEEEGRERRMRNVGRETTWIQYMYIRVELFKDIALCENKLFIG